MSALSITSVAAQGGNAQAPAEPGAPNAVGDNSPFAALLAALAAADPDLLSIMPSGPVQAAQTQTAQPQPASGANSQAPQAGAQTLAALVPQAPANDEDADAAAAGDAASQAGETPLPAAGGAPKDGVKPDKKADTGKTGTGASPDPSPLQLQALLPPQVPVAPVIQIAGGCDQARNPGLDVVGAAQISDAAPVAKPGNAPAGNSAAAAPQPASPQAPQLADNPNQTIASLTAMAPAAANDDDEDGGDEQSGAISASADNRTDNSSPRPAAVDVTAQTSQPADADAGEEPAPSQAIPSDMSLQTAPAGQQADASAPNLAAGQLAPRKPVANASGKSESSASANAPLPAGSGAAQLAAEGAQTFNVDPSRAADKNDDGKPAHGAANTAQQPDAGPIATPQTPMASQSAMPPAVAFDPGNVAAAGGASLTMHVASHDADSRQSDAPAATPNIIGLAVSVAARSLGGARQFDIRLDPPELGRVDVRLSIDASGKTQAHMTTDQPQTLALLQKDAPNLTRALRDAGLDVSQNGLNFSLRGQNQNQGGQNGHFGAPARRVSLTATVRGIEAAQLAATLPSSPLGNARLDIHV